MSQDDVDSLFDIPDDTVSATRPPRQRSPWLGVTALALVGVVAILDGVAISLAYDNDYASAIALAVIAIATATISFSLGLAAVITNRGRGWGVAALPLSVAANPYLLAGMLGMASGVFGS